MRHIGSVNLKPVHLIIFKISHECVGWSKNSTKNLRSIKWNSHPTLTFEILQIFRNVHLILNSPNWHLCTLASNSHFCSRWFIRVQESMVKTEWILPEWPHPLSQLTGKVIPAWNERLLCRHHYQRYFITYIQSLQILAVSFVPNQQAHDGRSVLFFVTISPYWRLDINDIDTRLAVYVYWWDFHILGFTNASERCELIGRG